MRRTQSPSSERGLGSPHLHFNFSAMALMAGALRIAGIKRLKTLDLVSTTRPWVWTLPATSTAGPLTGISQPKAPNQLLELHLHP